MSYDSPSRSREGDPIEHIVPDAIQATASRPDAPGATPHSATRGAHPLSGAASPFAVAATLAGAEALALVVLVLRGFGLC